MLRLTLATAALSGWLLVLLAGWLPAWAAHLLLVAGLVLFPWAELRPGPPVPEEDEAAGRGADGW